MTLQSPRAYFLSATSALAEADRFYKASVPEALRATTKRSALKQKDIDVLYAIIHTTMPIRLTERMMSLMSLSLQYTDMGFKGFLVYDPVALRRTQWVEIEVTFATREVKLTKVIGRIYIEVELMFDEGFSLTQVQIHDKKREPPSEKLFVQRFVHLSPDGVVLPKNEKVKVEALFTGGRVQFGDLICDMAYHALSEPVVLESYLDTE